MQPPCNLSLFSNETAVGTRVRTVARVGRDGDIYLVTQYYPNGSLGDVVRRLNADREEENQACRKAGDFAAIKTQGIKAYLLRYYL